MAKGRKQHNNDFKMNEVRDLVQQFISRARQENSGWLVIKYGVAVLNQIGEDRWYGSIMKGSYRPSVYCERLILDYDDMKLKRDVLEDVHPENEPLLKDRKRPQSIYEFIKYMQPFLGDKIKYAIEGAATFYCEIHLPGDVVWFFSINYDGWTMTRNGETVE